MPNDFSACSRFVAKHDPRGRVIARAFEPPHLSVNTGFNEAFGSFWVEQQMIDAKPGIAWPPVSHVVPEGVHRRIGMQFAHSVDPALVENAPKQGARLRLYKSVLYVGPSWIDVGIGRHDIESYKSPRVLPRYELPT
jgi:hypothetical protein